MAFIDEILRKSGIGVWKEMPYRESVNPVYNVPTNNSWKQKNNTGNLGRLSNDNLWRVSTRHEMVAHYNKVMHGTIRNLAYTLAFLWAGIYFFSSSIEAPTVEMSLITIVCAGFVSRHFTSAMGGFAGGWTDYENDPVRMVPHSAFVHSAE
jgi:hypothetical protein